MAILGYYKLDSNDIPAMYLSEVAVERQLQRWLLLTPAEHLMLL